jgi:hypothetical protein
MVNFFNLEVCISNSHVYGTVTPAVIVTVSNNASYVLDNRLVLKYGATNDHMTSSTVTSS